MVTRTVADCSRLMSKNVAREPLRDPASDVHIRLRRWKAAVLRKVPLRAHNLVKPVQSPIG